MDGAMDGGTDGRTDGGTARGAETFLVTSEDHFLRYYDATVRDAYRYASRLTGGDRGRAEDLVQEVYTGLLRKAKAGTIGEIGRGWIILSLRHRFLDSVRSSGREQRRLRLVWSQPSTGAETTPGDDILATVHLSDRERLALTLRYVDDLPVAEVAKVLGVSPRATESLLARARTRVRQEVRDA